MTEKLNIVYLYGFSPNECAKIETLLSLLNTQKTENLNIGIILIHDGVFIASSKRISSKTVQKLMELQIVVHVMIPDLKARGIALDSIRNGVKPIEYADLVDLMDSSEKIISWM